MKVGGTLLFGLVVLVNSIESANTPPRTPQSPGASAGTPPRRSSHSPVVVKTPPQGSPHSTGIIRSSPQASSHSSVTVKTSPQGSPHLPGPSHSPPHVPAFPKGELKEGNYLKPYYDRGDKLGPVTVTCEFVVNENGYKELYYLNEYFRLEKISGEIAFVLNGDTILGLGYNQFIHPLLNERGNIILIKRADRIEVTPEEAERHGVFRFYETEFAVPVNACPEQVKHEPHDSR